MPKPAMQRQNIISINHRDRPVTPRSMQPHALTEVSGLREVLPDQLILLDLQASLL